MEIGDKVQTIDAYWIGGHVTGEIIEDWGNTVVILDKDAETCDNRLEFKKSDLELLIRGNKHSQ